MRSSTRAAHQGALLLAGLISFTSPALAVDEVVVELPLLGSSLRVNIRELSSAEALLQGNSDLAELDRASDGALGRKLLTLLNQPLPVSFRQLAEASVGAPLLEQALLLVSSFGAIEGRSPDLTGVALKQALETASAASPNGQPTLLQLIKAIPGERVRLNLGRAQVVFERMLRHRRQAEQLMATAVPAPVAAPISTAPPVQPQLVSLRVPHRSEPLELLLIQPQAQPNGRLVIISHGLWDSPASFEGWAQHLVANGYTVVLPRHPGSDKHQQEQVLTGQAPPPSPAELGLRARDVSAINDAIASGSLLAGSGVDPQRLVVIGHSWGATTALQLAGLQPQDSSLQARCNNLNDVDRNLSWTLQCSWIRGVNQASIHDPRVIAVVAVSPPVSLLFPRGASQQMQGRVLLVSGTHDWVVPPDPEALQPFRQSTSRGNQLVLVQGGDHFNLRPGRSADGGVLGPLILEWTNRAFAAGSAVKPLPGSPPLMPSGSWGSTSKPMADVTATLQAR